MSRHCIPAEMEFDSSSTSPCYKTKDEELVIQKNDEIRLKIVGLRIDATDIVTTTNNNYVYMTTISSLTKKGCHFTFHSCHSSMLLEHYATTT